MNERSPNVLAIALTGKAFNGFVELHHVAFVRYGLGRLQAAGTKSWTPTKIDFSSDGRNATAKMLDSLFIISRSHPGLGAMNIY